MIDCENIYKNCTIICWSPQLRIEKDRRYFGGHREVRDAFAARIALHHRDGHAYERVRFIAIDRYKNAAIFNR